MGLYENRLVVKVGTSTLMNGMGRMDLRSTERLVQVLADISNMGYGVLLVSSGAILAGSSRLRAANPPRSLAEKQAAAAVGQCSLICIYDQFFSRYDKTVAQVLFSAEDIEQDQKRTNLTNTLNTLLDAGVIPVINANDPVNVGEIESDDHLFGDNDLLSAVVAVLCQAKRLALLSDIDGIYDCDPKKDRSARPLRVIDRIDENVLTYVATRASRRGADGVRTKLRAARYATEHGVETTILNGARPQALYELLEGKETGTLFRPAAW